LTRLDDILLQSAIDESICLRPYDPLWPGRFLKESRRLSIFACDLLEIEHIGSTAVPGLAAKPNIDMMAGVRTMADADHVLPALCQYGYVAPPGCNRGLGDRRWLIRHAGGRRTHHLHLVVLGEQGWRRTIRFRDLLRTHPEDAKEYEALKFGLALADSSNRAGYVSGKTEFVEKLLLKYPESAAR
jgi:GrpB-like predicted nucleotidyltransferase (UPF0157 family)